MKWRNRAYGLDIQGGCPIVVRATLLRGRLTFATCPAEEVAHRDENVDQRALAAAMPPRGSITQLIGAPYASRRKAMKVFPTILDIQLPFALEECVYQLLRVSRSDEQRGLQALAVVARTADVGETIHALHARGFDVTALDHEGLALWEQSLREAPVTSAETEMQRIVTYVGVDRMTVVIGKGTSYQNSHGVSMGNHAHIHRLIRSAVGASGQTVRWYWAGPGIVDEQKFPEIEHSLTATWPGHSSRHDDPTTFLARGLATRLLVPGTTPCNMRSGTLSHPAVNHNNRRHLMQTARLVLAAGIVLCVSSVAVMTWSSGRQNALNKQFVEKAENILGHSLGSARGEDALLMINRRTEEQRAELEPFLRNFLPSRTVLMNELLNAGKEIEMHFSVLSIQPNQVVVKGMMASTDRSDAISEVLNHHGYRVDPEYGPAGTDGRESFTVTAKAMNE